MGPTRVTAPLSVPASLKDVIATLCGLDPVRVRAIVVQDHAYQVALRVKRGEERETFIPVVADEKLDALDWWHDRQRDPEPADEATVTRIDAAHQRALALGADPEWLARRAAYLKERTS